jgi:hypothetical protein
MIRWHLCFASRATDTSVSSGVVTAYIYCLFLPKHIENLSKFILKTSHSIFLIRSQHTNEIHVTCKLCSWETTRTLDVRLSASFTLECSSRGGNRRLSSAYRHCCRSLAQREQTGCSPGHLAFFRLRYWSTAISINSQVAWKLTCKAHKPDEPAWRVAQYM